MTSVGITSDVQDIPKGYTHEWEKLSINGLNDIKIDSDAHDNLLLHTAFKEWNDVFDCLRIKISQERIGKDVTINNLVNLFINGYLKWLHQQLNPENMKKQPIPNYSNLINFFQVEILSSVMNVSPSYIYNESEYKLIVNMNDELHAQCLECLDTINNSEFAQLQNQHLVGQDLVNELCSEVLYSPNFSILSLQNNRLPIELKTHDQYFVKDSFARPMQHSILSICTGLHITGHIERRRDSLADILSKVILPLTKNKLDNPLIREKAYSSEEASRILKESYGSYDYLVEKSNKNFYYTSNQDTETNQEYITDKGTAATFYVKKISNDQNDEKEVYGMACRRNNTLQLFETAEEDFRPFVFRMVESNRARNSFIIIDKDITESTLESMWEMYSRTTNLITKERDGAEFEIVRKFRFNERIGEIYCNALLLQEKIGLDRSNWALRNYLYKNGEEETHKIDLANVNQLFHQVWFESQKSAISICILDTLIQLTPRWIHTWSSKTTESYAVAAIRKTGMQTSKGNNFMSTVVDATAFLQDETTKVVEASPILYRMCSTVEDKTTCFQFLQQNGSFVVVKESETSRLMEIIPFFEDRLKLLHTAAVIEAVQYLYIISTRDGVGYALLIPHSILQPLISLYKNEIALKCYTEYLQLFYNDTGNLQVIQMQHANNMVFCDIESEAYVQTFCLWKKLCNMVEESQEPLQPCNAIVPQASFMWNVSQTAKVPSVVGKSATKGVHIGILMNQLSILLHNIHLIGAAKKAIFDTLSESFETFQSKYANFFQLLATIKQSSSFNETLLTVVHELGKYKGQATMSDITQKGNIKGGKRRKRDDFNNGGFSSFRQEEGHQITYPTGLKKNYRPRCIVCCSICLKKNKTTSEPPKEHYRTGYKTNFGCHQCEVNTARACAKPGEIFEEKKIKSVVPLCRVARFPGDPRSCFEIHHSNGAYPKLSCKGAPSMLGTKKRSRLSQSV